MLVACFCHITKCYKANAPLCSFLFFNLHFSFFFNFLIFFPLVAVVGLLPFSFCSWRLEKEVHRSIKMGGEFTRKEKGSGALRRFVLKAQQLISIHYVYMKMFFSKIIWNSAKTFLNVMKIWDVSIWNGAKYLILSFNYYPIITFLATNYVV